MLTFKVPDMTCSHCVATVEKAVKSVDPDAKVAIDLQTKLVTIDSPLPAPEFAAAIDDVGYTSQPA